MENSIDYKNDVFISYSRKDYVQDGKIIPGNPISAIIELFDKNGISYWIDKDGIFVGEEFVKEISKAIANSRMLVFVASKNSNESEYTCGEILKAKKEKKQIIPFRIDKNDYNEKFEILLLPLQHVDYFEQCDAALSVLLCEVKREKKRIERIEADAEKQQIVEAARKEIKEKAKEYHALVGQQDDILKDLYAKNKIIGNTKKRCPVCDNNVLLNKSYCDKCGWQFPSLYSLDGREIPVCDESQLALARAHWHSLDNVVLLQQDIKRKEEEIEKEKRKNVELREQYEAFKQHQEGANTREWFFTVGGASFKMIRVEGGSMGTFYMGETQVTQALWQAVMGNNPSRFEGLDHPVECVSWFDICGKYGKGTDPNCFLYKLNQKTGMGFRLPTEAEWEFAAKGGNKNKNYTYAGSDDIDKVAWYWKNSGDNYLKGSDDDWDWDKIKKNNCKTHPVKQLSPNELGIYDMSGNVWEWCEDLYDPKGSARVLRGGSWYDIAKDCRVSYRGHNYPADGSNSLGFRLVLPQ